MLNPYSTPTLIKTSRNCYNLKLNHPTPFIPGMIEIIVNSGTRTTFIPHLTDFITPIKPVQNVEVKGLASGLQVLVGSTASYTFYNDDGNTQAKF
jgi:hypothetical protein